MKKFGLLVLAVALCMMQGASIAADQAQVQQQDKVKKPETVDGNQLMTREERDEYRARMRSLKTKEERDVLRMEHHQKMHERAKALGKTLPHMRGEACPVAGGGMKQCGAGSNSGAGCGTGGCCKGCAGMQSGMQHCGNAPKGETEPQSSAEPKDEATPGEHSH